MARSGRKAAAATLLAFASHTSAQLAKVCASTDVCFQLNIPESTASSGDGDIFFQISAPSSYEYVALGQGTRMSGSNMFVVYTSADGNNVTLSPRTAGGYSMPDFNGDAQVTLLEGSGVSNGMMVANVRCSSCGSWSGGTADFTGSTGDWIHAFRTTGGPKDSDDTNAAIQQHDDVATFQWDYANAKGGSSINPLVSTSPSGTASSGASPTSCIPRSASGNAAPTATVTGTGTVTSGPQATDDDSTSFGRPTSRPWGPPGIKRQEESLPYCDEVGQGNSTSGTTLIESTGGGGPNVAMIVAHGVLACLAFVIFFPAGAIAIRLASFRGIVWIHAAWQIFGYCVFVVAAALGIYLAVKGDMLAENHPIIGLVVFAVLFFMPILGWLHHLLFKKYSHRTLWSYAHLWIGRLAITLGIINGGLGFKLAKEWSGTYSEAAMIVYAVVAGIMWVAWVAATVVGERRRKMTGVERPPKYSTGTSPETTQREEVNPINGHYAPAPER